MEIHLSGLLLLQDFQDAPALACAQRSSLRNPNTVTHLAGVLLIMGEKLRSSPQGLPVQRMPSSAWQCWSQPPPVSFVFLSSSRSFPPFRYILRISYPGIQGIQRIQEIRNEPGEP